MVTLKTVEELTMSDDGDKEDDEISVMDEFGNKLLMKYYRDNLFL
jgi:hypothetical protein